MILASHQNNLFSITTQQKSNRPLSTQPSFLILQMLKEHVFVYACVCVRRNAQTNSTAATDPVCVFTLCLWNVSVFMHEYDSVYAFACISTKDVYVHIYTCVSIHRSLREQYLSNLTQQEQTEIWAGTVTLILKPVARSKGWV